VADDIRREFGIAADALIHTGFYPPKLEIAGGTVPIKSTNRTFVNPSEGTFTRSDDCLCDSAANSRIVADALCSNGFPARAYHAGLPNEERDAVQDWFMESSEAIVVATIAFGMGIDKSDIRYVYHYNLPKKPRKLFPGDRPSGPRRKGFDLRDAGLWK